MMKFMFDISGTKDNHEPNYYLISDLALQSRMPMYYEGAINTV